MRARLASLFVGVLLAASAAAQERVAVRSVLEQLDNEAVTGCAVEKRQLAAARASTPAPQMRENERRHEALCTCMPAKLREYGQRASSAELARQVTSEEFKVIMQTQALDPCLAAMFRDMFGGSLCRHLMTERTCACMAPEVARFTDKEGASLGSRFLEYKKAQAKSRKSGEPMPVPAPLVRRMLESMEKCQAG